MRSKPEGKMGDLTWEELKLATNQEERVRGRTAELLLGLWPQLSRPSFWDPTTPAKGVARQPKRGTKGNSGSGNTISASVADRTTPARRTRSRSWRGEWRRGRHNAGEENTAALLASGLGRERSMEEDEAGHRGAEGRRPTWSGRSRRGTDGVRREGSKRRKACGREGWWGRIGQKPRCRCKYLGSKMWSGS